MSDENTYYFRSYFFVFLIFLFFLPSPIHGSDPWIVHFEISHNMNKCIVVLRYLFHPPQQSLSPLPMLLAHPTRGFFTLPMDFYTTSLRLPSYAENYWKAHATTPILLSFARSTTFIRTHAHLENVATPTRQRRKTSQAPNWGLRIQNHGGVPSLHQKLDNQSLCFYISA